MRDLNRFASWYEVDDAQPSAHRPPPCSPSSPSTARPAPPTDRPNVRQRLNIGLVTIFSQAIQITFVGLALTGFFVLFGFLAIPEATVSGVDGARDVNVLGHVDRRRAHARAQPSR